MNQNHYEEIKQLTHINDEHLFKNTLKIIKLLSNIKTKSDLFKVFPKNKYPWLYEISNDPNTVNYTKILIYQYMESL